MIHLYLGFSVTCSKIVSEYVSKYHNHKLQVNPWHREEEPHYNHETPGRQTLQSNQLSLFPIKMIAKLEWTQSIAQQNIEKVQNPTMEVTTTNQQQQNYHPKADSSLSHRGDLYAFYWYQICTLDPAVVEAQNVKLALRLPNYCNVPS